MCLYTMWYCNLRIIIDIYVILSVNTDYGYFNFSVFFLFHFSFLLPDNCHCRRGGVCYSNLFFVFWLFFWSAGRVIVFTGLPAQWNRVGQLHCARRGSACKSVYTHTCTIPVLAPVPSPFPAPATSSMRAPKQIPISAAATTLQNSRTHPPTIICAHTHTLNICDCTNTLSRREHTHTQQSATIRTH